MVFFRVCLFLLSGGVGFFLKIGVLRFTVSRLLGIRVDGLLWVGLGLWVRGGRLDLTLERNVGGLGANDKRLLKEAEFLVVDPNGYQAVK